MSKEPRLHPVLALLFKGLWKFHMYTGFGAIERYNSEVITWWGGILVMHAVVRKGSRAEEISVIRFGRVRVDERFLWSKYVPGRKARNARKKARSARR